MGWPQITWIALAAMGVGIALVQHGQPRKPTDAWSILIGTAISSGLLYAGGFFG